MDLEASHQNDKNRMNLWI